MSEPTEPTDPKEFLESVKRLSRDLRNSARMLSREQARFLVDAYYQMQEDRIRAAHQWRTLSEHEEPNDIMPWLLAQRGTLEKEVAKVLDVYSDSQQAGQWMRSICGIGPIIAAGLLCHIDITKAPTAGHIWRFAGLDPTVKWEAKTKRPWNASLKRLCFLIGESFVKVSGRDDDVYGKVYKERKAKEEALNASGAFAEQAAQALKEKKFGDDTDAKKHYLAGRLPPARIHLRAKRYAVKLFLAHVHHVMYERYYHELPPKPYALTHLEHAHYIGPPNWPMMR